MLSAHSYDIDENGKIGYIPAHLTQFVNHISTCLSLGGGLTLRQFTKETIAVKGKGKIMRVPIKNLYGARMGNGHWEWISGDKMRSAHCTGDLYLRKRV